MDIKKLVIRVVFKVDTGSLKKVEKATNDVKSAMAGFANSAKGVAKVLFNMRAQMDKLSQTADALVNTFRKSFIILMSLWALGKFAGSFVRAAGEVEEMLNALDIAFGDNANVVIKWADDYAQATGRSKYELREMAGQFALVMKPNISDMQTLIRLSTGLAERATDMASALQEAAGEGADVRKAVISALTGETESIKRWSVILTDKQLKEEIEILGLKKKYKAMTQQERIELRYQAILRQTSHLMGDAIKTRYQYTNTMKNLAGAIKDVQRAIGKGMLPVALKLSNWFIDITRGMLDWFEKGERMEAMLASIGVALGLLALKLGITFLPLLAALTAVYFGFREIQKIAEDVIIWAKTDGKQPTVFGKLLDALGITRDELTGAYSAAWGTAARAVKGFGTALKGILTLLGEALGQMLAFVFLMMQMEGFNAKTQKADDAQNRFLKENDMSAWTPVAAVNYAMLQGGAISDWFSGWGQGFSAFSGKDMLRGLPAVQEALGMSIEVNVNGGNGLPKPSVVAGATGEAYSDAMGFSEDEQDQSVWDD